MNHCVAVGAHRNQVGRGIHNVGPADSSKRFEMVDVYEPCSRCSVSFVKAHATDLASGTVKPKAHGTKSGLALIDTMRHYVMGALFDRLSFRLKQARIWCRNLLAVEVQLRWVGIEHRVCKLMLALVPKYTSLRNCAARCSGAALNRGWIIDTLHRVRVRRVVPAHAIAVSPSHQVASLTEPAQLKGCGNQHFIRWNLHDSCLSLPSSPNFDDQVLCFHWRGQCRKAA